MNKFQNTLWKVLDWIFPPFCPGCNKTGIRLCEDCRSSIRRISDPICPVCGEPGNDSSICQDCLNYPPEFDRLRSAALFDGVIRESLHRLKYNNDIGLGEILAPFLVEVSASQNWDIDLVTSVPLSNERLRMRGYNQAECLAKPFAAMIGKLYAPSAILRIKNTKSQIDLSAGERRENVSGAFYANSSQVVLKSVIIIDDVSTTGSTISECARALKLAGAKGVYALTLARAPIRTDR
ncbi:MAG: ComF family protein [Leptolinea sp.]|nr:ComF family protein [Leptolinea sp.]